MDVEIAGDLPDRERDERDVPPAGLYATIAAELGEALFPAKQKRLVGARRLNVDEKDVVRCLTLRGGRGRARMHLAALSFVEALCKGALEGLSNRSTRFLPPVSLPRL